MSGPDDHDPGAPSESNAGSLPPETLAEIDADVAAIRVRESVGSVDAERQQALEEMRQQRRLAALDEVAGIRAGLTLIDDDRYDDVVSDQDKLYQEAKKERFGSTTGRGLAGLEAERQQVTRNAHPKDFPTKPSVD